jgi:hypothetical protein
MICINVIFAYSAKAEVPDIDVNKLISPRDLRMKQEVGKQIFSVLKSGFRIRIRIRIRMDPH